MSINVVGGTYLEVCREPAWEELYGSGLRGAAALSALDPDVRLLTWISDEQRPTLDAYAQHYGIALDARQARSTLKFSYVHGLSRPWIDPPLHLLTPAEQITLSAPTVLRYGTLESDAVVNGNTVVYDPQSTYDARPFSENGSSARRLAIVANRREGAAMTGEESVDDIGAALLAQPGAEVVLIKRGALGVWVFQRGGTDRVPAYRNDFVFPIGSGDVFSAAFAHRWATEGADPVEAADFASRSVAFYCGSQNLPIPRDVTDRIQIPLVPTTGGRQPRRVYLAGPFFTTAERWLVSEARDGLLQQGLEVFSPFHDVGVGPADEVVPKDIAALRSCDAVLAIIDGFDAGTSFEVGYARSLNIPVVAFVQNEPEEPLKMLVGTGCEITGDFVSAVYHAAWAALQR